MGLGSLKEFSEFMYALLGNFPEPYFYALMKSCLLFYLLPSVTRWKLVLIQKQEQDRPFLKQDTVQNVLYQPGLITQYSWIFV